MSARIVNHKFDNTIFDCSRQITDNLGKHLQELIVSASILLGTRRAMDRSRRFDVGHGKFGNAIAVITLDANRFQFSQEYREQLLAHGSCLQRLATVRTKEVDHDCLTLPSSSTAFWYSRAINGDKNSSSKSGSVMDFAKGSFSRFAELREARITSSLVTIVVLIRIDRVGFFLGLPIGKIVACITFLATSTM